MNQISTAFFGDIQRNIRLFKVFVGIFWLAVNLGDTNTTADFVNSVIKLIMTLDNLITHLLSDGGGGIQVSVKQQYGKLISADATQ